jgi:hypothetical protein
MTNPKLALISSGYKNSKVYSILPNDGSGDFTFARNSGGTRVNKQGLIEQMQTYGSQLLNNSDFTSTSDWTVSNTGSAASVIENGYLHINTSGDYSVATQAVGLTAGDIYRVDYEILENTAGTISIIGNGGASTIIPSTVGKHTIEYDAQSTFAVKRTTGSTNIKIAYIKLYKVQYNTPRLDWSDSNCPSLLEALDNYSNSNTVCTLNYAISPDGTKNATRVDFTASFTNALGVNGTVNNGETITQSIFVKYIDAQFVQLWFGSAGFNGGNTNFDLINGTTSNPSGSSSTMENIGNGWWRISSTRTATSTSSNTGIFKLVVVDSLTSSRFGDEANGSVLAFGGQYEQKSHPTSYIPTFAGTSTRLTDTCTDAGDATIFNDSEGVLYAEIKPLSDNVLSNQRSIQLEGLNGSSDNEIIIQYLNNTLRFLLYGNSVLQLQRQETVSLSSYTKVALLYKNDAFKIYINGTERYTVSGSYTMPIGLNKINFDRSGVSNFYGKCKDLRYYDTALTDAELTELTT